MLKTGVYDCEQEVDGCQGTRTALTQASRVISKDVNMANFSKDYSCFFKSEGNYSSPWLADSRVNKNLRSTLIVLLHEDLLEHEKSIWQHQLPLSRPDSVMDLFIFLIKKIIREHPHPRPHLLFLEAPHPVTYPCGDKKAFLLTSPGSVLKCRPPSELARGRLRLSGTCISAQDSCRPLLALLPLGECFAINLHMGLQL